MPDRPPTAEELRQLEDRVMSRFSGWLGKHGYLGSEDGESEDSDAWWRAGANEPSGLLSSVPGKVRRTPRFDVNAGVRVGEGDKVGREQLCRYVARPPLAEAQLELLDDERVRLEFRSPLRSGQTSLILHPLALMRRLAWLVPPPGQHQIRYCGVLGLMCYPCRGSRPHSRSQHFVFVSSTRMRGMQEPWPHGAPRDWEVQSGLPAASSGLSANHPFPLRISFRQCQSGKAST